MEIPNNSFSELRREIEELKIKIDIAEKRILFLQAQMKTIALNST